MLSLGIDLWSNVAALGGGGGGAFTPASIPGLDLWIEADPTKLYTDAGTTLVSADGQAVQQANDKSSAARNLSQATLAARPLYKTDLAKPSLKFTAASSQYLQSASGPTWLDGSGQCWFAMSVQPTAVSSVQEIIAIDGSTGVISDVYIGGSQAHMEIKNVGGTFLEDATAASTLTAGASVVIIATVTTTAMEAFVNNVSNGSTAVSGTLKTDSNTAFIGSDGGSNPFDGRVFGIVHGTGTLSSSDRANLQTYMAALHP